VATFVYASSQGQRTHSARTKNRVQRTEDFKCPLCEYETNTAEKWMSMSYKTSWVISWKM
jgi:hypothetical protein